MKTIDSISSNLKIKAGILIIIVLTVFRFAVFPLNQWNQDNIDKIFLLKKSISAKEKILNQGKEIEINLEKVSKSLNQASNLFWYDFSDSGDLLLKTQKMVEKKAENIGFKIQSIQWGQPFGDKIIKAPMDLKLSALPNDLLRFIAEIESADKFYSLDSIRFICRPKIPEIQVSMTVSAYGVK